MNRLKFSGSWRDYQKRILDDLNFHLADNKIHVVAAPGAGKTTLGIEVIARIHRPTLILAPTITIRNQWRQRIIDSFLNGNSEDIISVNIKEPAFITIITYQALLAAFCDAKENTEEETPVPEEDNQADDTNYEEDLYEDKITTTKRFNQKKAENIINLLKDNNIKLLCFDEAHHLRKEWWKALDYLTDNLEPEQTVALTATPPYDADGREWERYETLCGPIDEIISIPELVANKDLCPHQDFIHFSLMRKHEDEKYKECVAKTGIFLKGLLKNDTLAEFVTKQIKRETEEAILDNPKMFIAVLSYLKTSNNPVPAEILELFSLKKEELPRFNTEYQKLFLTYVFADKDRVYTEQEKKFLDVIAKQARDAGVLQNKTIYLNDSPKLKRQIANSLGKLDSIKKIVDLEVSAMHEDLRMVILADYIKYDNTDASELGVIPIWQTLKERTDISLAVLTGSVILIPEKLKDDFERFVKSMNLEDYVSSNEFDRDKNFLKIIPKGSKKSLIVELITNMFNDGHITVIVGTQALLGEGWDAPCINSLILSSTVSSYMLSNQMRGRAIRIDKNDPDKISNIWHLASVKILSAEEQFFNQMKFSNTESSDNIEPNVELSDYFQLHDRFVGFQAPSVKSPYYIESGIERILPDSFLTKLNGGLTAEPLKESDFLLLNRTMERNAFNRHKTKELWEQGTTKNYDGPERMLHNGVSADIKLKDFCYTNGYYTILAQWGLVWAGMLLTTVYPAVKARAYFEAFIMFCICIIGFCISVFKPTLKYLRCSSPEKIMRQIGIVFLETLAAMGRIKVHLKNVIIKCETNPADQTIFFAAGNISPEENNLLINSILEFINPIENPRYLFVRKDKIAKLINTTDYHSMPAVISANKSNIDIFKKLWEKYIGKCDIIYTRNAEGRKKLLKARKDSFSDLIRTKKAKKMSRFE